jgi:hypothetical protein
MNKYIIGRVCNRHGVSDYYAGKDNGEHCFMGKPKAQVFTNHNTAYGMAIRLKRLLPTIIGGFPASYKVIELEEV